MSYRNKTYVAFASEDIHYYRLMEAWRDNRNIDFNFYDSHDLYQARDSSLDETIKGRLYQRISQTAKQVVLLGSTTGRRKGGNGTSFLAYEVQTIIKLNLPVVVANLDGDRGINESFIPKPFLDANYYMAVVSYQPTIIKYALDGYAPGYATSGNSGPHYYPASTYASLGL